MQQKILNNRYELEQKIGEGGMARVYRGRDLRLSRQVAVKVLHSHYASDAGFLQRFHHEAQAAANLRHPHIVDVYDVGQDGDLHYIVMEYVPGSDLKALIVRQAPLPVEQAVMIAEAVAKGLDAAHRLGMIHRDIKPQNIIIGEAGQVKITDFGIAKSKMSTALTETGVTFGTADYISPEQARGQPAGPQSDLYSLGVTLYEMLTGRLPFSGDSSIAVAMQHVSAEPPPPRMYNPRIPPQLEAIVLQALNKAPADRPASARKFAQLLASYRDAGEQATLVRPVAPRPAPPRPNSGTTAPRPVLPPARPAVVTQQRPDSRGMGFGGFILGLLLLGGVLGLVYLFVVGAFDGLFTFAGSTGRPTPVATEPQPGTPVVPQVPVPDLLGKTEAEARAALQALGLGVGVAAPQNSDVITAGLVLEQFPPANMPVDQAATSVVTLTLSLGPELVDVPDVQRTRATDARSLLAAAGFQVQVREEASTLSEGFVISQDPVNVKLPRGQTVTIVVSMGNKVVVPEITGLSEAEARARIAAAGLFVSFVDPQGCDKLGALCDRFGPGMIVSADPRPGTRVERGSGVTLGQRAP
ncbi:MAG: Stk1 family PASTA domain-containing Ser/Thr kinase [Kouleothrix sp.]|jgi:serine/threonine-protein kinase|nr:Stk1 family PASTA domain-containing Ser/Thr kinase [Kouleothrix sp.]